MQIINKAYEAAKNRFSDEETQSFAGFSWETEVLSGLHGMISFERDVLRLEGNGELVNYRDRGAENDVYLAFDRGDAYLSDQSDFRQHLNLKPFFAWTELAQGIGLCPTLLDDVVAKYKFDDNQAEQLRQMILNGEGSDFMFKTLNISTKGFDHFYLLHFLNDVYSGPTFSHLTGPRTNTEYPLGVEFTPEGGIVLTYQAEEAQGAFMFGRTYKDEAYFTPVDVQMMRSVAYGPLLQQPKSEE